MILIVILNYLILTLKTFLKGYLIDFVSISFQIISFLKVWLFAFNEEPIFKVPMIKYESVELIMTISH